MFLTVAVGRLTAAQLSRVNVQAVLALLGETDEKRDDIVVGHRVRHELAKTFLLHAVLVQRCHEVGQWARHAELQLQLAASKHQRVL